MKTIIISYSFSGNNKLLAEHLKEKLNCDAEEIVELKKRKSFSILLDIIFNRDARVENSKAFLDSYDMVIFVAPIWAARIATPMKSFIRRERNNIRKFAFITLCGGQEGQHGKLNSQLYELAQQEPVAVAELEINDLLPLDQRGKVKYTTPYRVNQKDLKAFEPKIRTFIGEIIDFEDQNEFTPKLNKSA